MPARIEYATSNTSKCQSSLCGGTIVTEGSLHFGSVVDLHGASRMFGKHWGCVTPSMLSNLKRRIKEISELDGYQDLNDEDKARLDVAFKDGHVADTDVTGSASKPTGDKDGGKNKEAKGEKQEVQATKKKPDNTNGKDEADKPEKDMAAAPHDTVELDEKTEPEDDDDGIAGEAALPSDLNVNTTFEGRSPGGISCEQFVRAIRKHSIAEKKTRDNEYLAEYVLSCLDGEALHWSETLSMEVRGDWNLLRQALLAEYGTSASSPAISNVLIPTLDTASVRTYSSIATSPIPSTTSLAEEPLQDGPSAGHGRIRLTVGAVSYYVGIIGDRSLGLCVATQDINSAAIMEVVDIDGGIELRFVNPDSTHATWLGMVWDSKSIDIRSHAALISAKVQGSSTVVAEGISRRYWVGDVNVVKWTRSEEGLLSPRRDVNRGIPVVVIRISRAGGDNYLYISNDLKTFPLHNGYKMKDVQLVFEPL